MLVEADDFKLDTPDDEESDDETFETSITAKGGDGRCIFIFLGSGAKTSLVLLCDLFVVVLLVHELASW